MNVPESSQASPAMPGAWLWHRDAGAVKVVDHADRWGETTYRLWSPSSDDVLYATADEVEPIAGQLLSLEALLHRVSSARIQESLSEDLLLAPIRSSVTPLPHQLYALERAMAHKQVRYLFADEVGLGKTIEAGLVIRELKLRGLVKRVLVIAPKGLTPQWQAEMLLHFGERFTVADPSDFDALRRWSTEDNLWMASDQIICSLDSVKPLARRRGWGPEQIANYNQQRFEDLITAGWDLVIVDEAHRLGGSTDQVARYKLGAALADASPYLLLLSATPHSGKTDQFLRLMQLLDREAFPDESSVTRERVAPFVVRTEKRMAIDNEGKPLFKPRQTRLVGVDWQPRHEKQRQLYEAVTDYVRHGYNQALKSKQRHIGFLMVLMQRLVTSSTAAIAATLQRRLEVLEVSPAQLSFLPDFDPEDVADLDGQAQLDELIDWPGWKSERAEVETLLTLAEEARAAPDAKAEALLNHIYRLQQEEGDPALKVLIFTEFVPTQAMLASYLGERGFEVATLNGQMPLEERLKAQQAFAGPARVLVSTDAGGEGLNLQFAHVIVNFDMPWNPMRIEQRIGRVDRIGQKHVVRALNFILADTVEYRVRDVLEQKLAAIAVEFGIDKAADVMDSAEAEAMFDGVYVDGLTDPAQIEVRVDATLAELRERIVADRERGELLTSSDNLDASAAQRLRDHPVHFWLERAISNGVPVLGGVVKGNPPVWSITWPAGTTDLSACFDPQIAEDNPELHWITLENAHARQVVNQIPVMSPDQPLTKLSLSGLPSDLSGVWSLWCVELDSPRGKLRRYLPLYVQGERTFAPTARRIWDIMVSPEKIELTGPGDAHLSTDDLEAIASAQAEPIYLELKKRHQADLATERERLENAFEARRRAIGRIGLPNVRKARLARLETDHEERLHALQRDSRALPRLDLIAAFEVSAS